MEQQENRRISPTDPSRRQPDVLARLEQAVGQIQDSETFRRYLDIQARFHHYSPNNAALILAQRPEATRVAGYNDWLRMHRYVRRGEKAIKIIVPMFKTTVDEESGEERRRVFFGVGNVFDLGQTDGEPLPEIDVPVLQGEAGEHLYTGLLRVADREGLRVERAPGLAGEMMGFYERGARRIVLRLAAQLQMTKTLAHELAHHFSGHGSPEDNSPRAEQETVAESVSYVALAHYGLDSGERSFPYIATWSRDRMLLQQAMSIIQKISATIIDRVERYQVQVEDLLPAAGGAPTRIYHGYSEDHGSAMGPEAVFVEDEEGRVARLKHEVRHSPDGFSWGYSGSGPADLARSILADHLGYVPPPSIYQQFKRKFVACWEQGRPWQISSEQIEEWIVSSGSQSQLDHHLAWIREEAELRRLSVIESAAAHRQRGEPAPEDICPRCGAPDDFYCQCPEATDTLYHQGGDQP
jgi:hypothetical protein